MARKVTLEPRQCAPSLKTANVRTHTRAVFEELAARFAVYYAWGNGGSGDHQAGKAVDLMAYAKVEGSGPSGFAYQADGDIIPGPIRKGWNADVAEYVRRNWKRLGVDYIIYDDRIMSNNPGGYAYGGPALTEWQDYTGTSHDNHVHISLEENPPAYKPPTSTPKPQPEPKPEPELPNPEDLVAGVLPAQLVQVEGKPAVYAVTLLGVVHIKNPTHLRYLRQQGWVTDTIRAIPATDLAELLEKE